VDVTALPANFKYLKPEIVDGWQELAGELQPETGQIVVHKAVS
jgi:hypothetical protein